MSKVYLAKRGLFRRSKYTDRESLMDIIETLQLEYHLCHDELMGCQEILAARNDTIRELQNKLRKAEIKIEHLKLELDTVSKSLDIVTEEKE